MCDKNQFNNFKYKWVKFSYEKIEWLNGLRKTKSKTQLYAAYLRITLALRHTQAKSKRMGRDSPCKQKTKDRGAALLIYIYKVKTCHNKEVHYITIKRSTHKEDAPELP